MTALILLFIFGYAAIIFEHNLHVNKTAVAILTAIFCWTVYFHVSALPLEENLTHLKGHIADASQIIFFLMGAMAVVELIDSHNGFHLITSRLSSSSKRQMLWLVSLVTFFLSAVLDNLTTTILMVSLLRKILPNETKEEKEEKLLFCSLVVVAANAGGAWTPMGDVTTTMLWINGQISALKIVKALFVPSLISLVVPLAYFSLKMKGSFEKKERSEESSKEAPHAKTILFLGVGSLVFVPIFKALTDLPPFMGVLAGLSLLWLVTDYVHERHDKREYLRVPNVFTRIDTSGMLFFLGILLAVNALETAGVLGQIAEFLQRHVGNDRAIATLIGVFSAIIDNVPLVAASMGMYPIAEFAIDHEFWHMVAYAAGTGGSMLIIGSSSGIALMGMEKIDFMTYAKKMTIPVAIGYLAGIGAYLLGHLFA